MYASRRTWVGSSMPAAMVAIVPLLSPRITEPLGHAGELVLGACGQDRPQAAANECLGDQAAGVARRAEDDDSRGHRAGSPGREPAGSWPAAHALVDGRRCRVGGGHSRTPCE